jgi:hypothetical protein
VQLKGVDPSKWRYQGFSVCLEIQKVSPDWKEHSEENYGCSVNEVAAFYSGVRKALVVDE